MGEIVYIPGQDDAGHQCQPPVPSIEPKGTIWLCGCGKTWVHTEYSHIAEAWRRARWHELRIRKTVKRALAAKRDKIAAEKFRRDEKIVMSFRAGEPGLEPETGGLTIRSSAN